LLVEGLLAVAPFGSSAKDGKIQLSQPLAFFEALYVGFHAPLMKKEGATD